MSKKKLIMKEIFTFLLVTTLLSSFFYYLMIQQGSIKSPGNISMLGLMWCPGLAAIITQLWYHKRIDIKILKQPPVNYLAISYFTPLAYSMIVYGIIWITGLGAFFDPNFLIAVTERYGFLHLPAMALLIFHIAYAMTLGVLLKSVFALGEELGWRGFLVPKLLQLTSISKTAIIIGVIWALWHYPMIIFVDYNAKAPVLFTLVCFTTMIIGLSFLLTWLWIKTESIWPAVLFHASHNLFIQQIFNPLTADTGQTKYFVGEFGIGAASIGIVLTISFLRLFLATKFKP